MSPSVRCGSDAPSFPPPTPVDTQSLASTPCAPAHGLLRVLCSVPPAPFGRAPVRSSNSVFRPSASARNPSLFWSPPPKVNIPPDHDPLPSPPRPASSHSAPSPSFFRGLVSFVGDRRNVEKLSFHPLSTAYPATEKKFYPVEILHLPRQSPRSVQPCRDAENAEYPSNPGLSHLSASHQPLPPPLHVCCPRPARLEISQPSLGNSPSKKPAPQFAKRTSLLGNCMVGLGKPIPLFPVFPTCEIPAPKCCLAHPSRPSRPFRSRSSPPFLCIRELRGRFNLPSPNARLCAYLREFALNLEKNLFAQK